MNQDTPAIDIKDKDLIANVKALSGCLALIKEPIRSVIDVRYGKGGWAKEVIQTLSVNSYVGYEQDRATADIAWKNKVVTLRCRRFDPELDVGKCDLLLADFNTLTKMKRELLDELLEAISARYLVFTDVCCSKLHLNYRSYSLEEASLDLYWRSFKVGGYRLLGWRKEHYAASTAIYTSTKKPPRAN